jgi:antitoxin (DNA-binding transcriptional repressor) of toxin-antitoxin stability system
MNINATQLRRNLYRMLDHVLDSGEPVIIERRGRILKIVPEERSTIWDRLEPHDTVVGDSEELVDLSWQQSWNPDDPS